VQSKLKETNDIWVSMGGTPASYSRNQTASSSKECKTATK